MVHPSNSHAFVRDPVVRTPVELLYRNKLKTVEGGYGTNRTTIRPIGVKGFVQDNGGNSVIPLSQLELSGLQQSLAPDLFKQFWPKLVARARLPEEVGLYNQLQLMSPGRVVTGAKNYDTISFSRSFPSRSYGNIGLMTVPSKVSTPLSGSYYGKGLKNEIKAHPVLMGDSLVLPRAEGAIVYDPRSTPRDLAIKLKQKGGVPLNAGFFRKIKLLADSAPENKYLIPERGNLSLDELMERFPGKLGGD